MNTSPFEIMVESTPGSFSVLSESIHLSYLSSYLFLIQMKLTPNPNPEHNGPSVASVILTHSAFFAAWQQDSNSEILLSPQQSRFSADQVKRREVQE